MHSSVTLTLTVLNQEPYLNATIKSILNQTHQDFELLIWDEGSTDRSIEIAQHYAAQDHRVNIIISKHPTHSSSLKSAISASQSTYLGWINSGDLLAQTALEETINILNTYPEIGLVYTDYLVINQTDSIEAESSRCRIPYSEERLLTDFIIFQFRLMRRSLYDQVGGINDLFPYCQDYDLCLKLSEVTQFFHLQKPFYYYRRYTNNASCQEQIEKILWAKEIVEQALRRRKKTDEYELEVQFFSHCNLLNKTTQVSVQASVQASVQTQLESTSAYPSSWKPVNTLEKIQHTELCLQFENFLDPQEKSDLLKYVLQQKSRLVSSDEITNTDVYPDHRQSLILFSFPPCQAAFASRIWALVPDILAQIKVPPFVASKIETQLTAHNDGHFYKIHTDNDSPETANRVITYVYYFYQDPKPFSGGDLLIYKNHKMPKSPQLQPDLEAFELVKPINNSIVFFPSHLWHEVKPVQCSSQDLADSRFTINGWIRSHKN